MLPLQAKKKMQSWIRSRHLICSGNFFIFETLEYSTLDRFAQCVTTLGGALISVRKAKIIMLGNHRKVVLYRAKFCLSIKSARQFIFHGHVLVNKCVVKTPSYILRTDDLIEIAWNIRPRNLVKQNIMSSNFWPLSPKYLVINYNTLQIIF